MEAPQQQKLWLKSKDIQYTTSLAKFTTPQSSTSTPKTCIQIYNNIVFMEKWVRVHYSFPGRIHRMSDLNQLVDTKIASSWVKCGLHLPMHLSPLNSLLTYLCHIMGYKYPYRVITILIAGKITKSSFFGAVDFFALIVIICYLLCCDVVTCLRLL